VHFEISSGRRARFTTPVLNGDLEMPAERIIKAAKFRRWIIHTWKPVTDARLRDALDTIRSLYQKQRRLEAKVSMDSVAHNAADNTVRPTLQIDAGPRIQIQTTGAKVSGRKLSEYIPVFEEHTIDNDLLAEGAHNLQDYFQSQGYFDADVKVQPETVADGVATINYDYARVGPQAGADRHRGQSLFRYGYHPRAPVSAHGGVSRVPARPLQPQPAEPRRGGDREPVPVQRLSGRESVSQYPRRL
jgi:outer membrane protein assembly factor BamA